MNKQYSKDEYEKLISRIIEHMNEMPYVDKKGRIYAYGEFFPLDFSPFAYNESFAQEHFPLTKKEVEEQGLVWRESKKRDIETTKLPADMPDKIREATEDVLKEIIACPHGGTCDHDCTMAFKMISQEFQFCKRLNIPFPRLCPNCRHHDRFKWRNPTMLWKRICHCSGAYSENNAYINTATHFHGDGSCPNEFETSYAPERKEIVYCEACYQAEVE